MLAIALLLLGGVFFLFYWLGKQVWLHAPAWKDVLDKPDVQRAVLLFTGAVLGLGLLTLDFMPVHSLPLDSVRAAVCITGAGIALLARRTSACAASD